MLLTENKNIWENITGQIPDGAYLSFSITTTDPESKLSLIKEVVAVISKFNEDDWPEDSIWDNLFPKWFLEKIKKNSLADINKDDRLWDYGSWLDAMKFRGWQWFSSNIKTSGFEIVLAPNTLPYSVNPLEYVIFESGIDLENILFKEHL